MPSFRKAQAMPVATIAEGAVLGKLEDFQFDLESGRIYGFHVKSGVFRKTGGVPADAVVRLGRDLVYVSTEDQVAWTGAPKVSVPGRAWASEYRGLAVLSRRGSAVGTVEDLEIALEPARVTAILLDGGRRAELGEHVHTGRDSVVVADAERIPRPEAEEDRSDWWRYVRGLFDGER